MSTAVDADTRAARWSKRWLDADAGRLFVCGLAALFWELVLIRWLGANIRIVAYFSNLVLISRVLRPGRGRPADALPLAAGAGDRSARRPRRRLSGSSSRGWGT